MVRPAPSGISHQCKAEGEGKSQTKRHCGGRCRDEAANEEKGETCNKVPARGKKASKTDNSEKKNGSGEENTKKTTKKKAKGKEDADTETGEPFASSDHSESTGGESGESYGTE